MRFVLTVALTLALLTIESVIRLYSGAPIARIDATVAIVAFLALRASTVEGAVSAFTVGYMLDAMTGQPTGLYAFLAVLTFLLGRLAAQVVDVRSAFGFALFAGAASLGHVLLELLLTWLTSRMPGASASSLLLHVALTALVAALVYPLLKKLDPGAERPEVGALR